jgi:hypothetical protein
LSQERQSIVVPQGNRVMARVGVQRRGVAGDVRFDFDGLPTGTSFACGPVAADQFWTPVVIEAKSEAPLAAAFVDVRGSLDSERSRASGHFSQVVDLVAGPADALFQAVTVDRLAVAVTEPAPIQIRLDNPLSPLPQDGTLGLVLHVERSSDYEGPVEVRLPFLPPWVDGPAAVTIPEDATTFVYPLRAFPEAETRQWSICAEAKPGRARGDYGVRRAASTAAPRRSRSSNTAVMVASQLVTLQVAPPPVTGTIGVVSAEQGQAIRVRCQLTRRGELPNQLTATLEGLPNRVAAEPVTVDARTEMVEFATTIDPTAPAGSFAQLGCRLTGKLHGQEVSYFVGRGGVLNIAPSGTLVTDEDGRALSPLEVLRRRAAATSGPYSSHHTP